MPTLTGAQTGTLSQALREAFASVDDFAEFLAVMLDKRLENIVSLRLGYQTVTFRLTNGNKVTAEARDKTRLHGFTLANVPYVGPGGVLGLSPGGSFSRLHHSARSSS